MLGVLGYATSKTELMCAYIPGFFFTKFLEDLVGPTLRQAEFFVLSFEFFSYSEFFRAEDTK